jgi:iron-sulfur cluster assembly accessory protein
MSIQVEVTKEAQSQVRELIKSQKPGTAVRVFLQAGGGCGGGDACGCGGAAASGPSFGMSFDHPRNGDEVVKVDGFALVVDASTASQLDGSRIDYVQELEQTGFKIVSPQRGEPSAPIGSGCGCGAGGGGCC